MDYKYISQLIELYFKGETSLEEEEILRTFFTQSEVPAEFAEYKALFTYQHDEVKNNALSDDFDERILKLTTEQQPKARIVRINEHLRPLFRAAAMVAIVVTLGNAIQMPMQQTQNQPQNMAATQPKQDGVSVAMTDSSAIDTLKCSEMSQEELKTSINTISSEVIMK